MKKKKLNIVLLLILFIVEFPVLSYAQESEHLIKGQTVYSPQVTEMICYDRVLLQKNKGCVDLSISLLEWKDRDFNLPLTLFYNSAGFRPREVDNYVGRNWMLSVGGVVYRRVNGVPDDMNNAINPLDAQTGKIIHTNGFLNILNRNMFDLKDMEEDFKDNPYRYTHRKDMETSESTIPGTNNVESSADVFYFSFGGHSGKFLINYDGSVSACGNNGGRYEVDLSSMALFDTPHSRETYIRIKTADGYVYTFGGGGYSSLEYNVGWEEALGQQEGLNVQNEITAYHLTEIKAPNGRKMTFVYRDIDEKCHSTANWLRTLVEQGTDLSEDIAMQYTLSGKAVYRNYNMHSIYCWENEPLKPNKQLYTLTKNALMDHIAVDGKTIIKFHYSMRDKHVTCHPGENESVFPYLCGCKLDKLEMCLSSTVDCSVSFDYTYQAGGRMFLQSVRHSSEGRYTFSYHLPSLLTAPTPFTHNIDYWGFWRGRTANKGILPALRSNRICPQEYTVVSDDRQPTGEDYDYTLLRQVTYPTGGKSVFEYEANHYSNIPYLDVCTDSRPSFANRRDCVAGGARVRSITHYSTPDTAVRKSIFTYGEPLCLGDILYMPHFKYTGTLMKENGGQEYVIEYVCMDSEGVATLPHSSTHILYPNVTEHFVHPSVEDLTEAHPFKVTLFEGAHLFAANDFVFPTYRAGEGIGVNPDAFFPTFSLQAYNRRLLEQPDLDASLSQGKIIAERWYNTKSELIRQTTYEYEYINRDKYALRTYAPCPYFRLRTGLYTHLMKEPLFSYALKQTTTIDYLVSGEFSTAKTDTERYLYDTDGDLLEKSRLKSNGDTLITRYNREVARNSSGFQKYLNEELVYKAPGGEIRTPLWRKVTSYYPITTPQGCTWNVPLSFGVYHSGDTFVSRTWCSDVDDFGNPLEVGRHTGDRVTYIWGFNGKYLLARIENASWKEVEELLEIPVKSYSHTQGNREELNDLRVKLPQARVYTYTYSDGVGLTSETSPNGCTIYYNYDRQGRLSQVSRLHEGKQGDILQLYNYHIVNQ